MTTSNPLLLILLLPLAVFIIGTARSGYLGLSARRLRVATAVRLALVAAVVLGLAGASLTLPQNREATIFVSDLSASDAAQQGTMRSAIATALAHRPGDALAGIIAVGRQAAVEQPPSTLTGFDGFQTANSLDTSYTNLEGGLNLAAAIFPPGYRRRVVLLSDGQQNMGDALGTARLLRAEGIRVDVFPVRVPAGPEVRVDSVTAPSNLRQGERFSLQVALHSTVATTGGLDIYRDHQLVLSRRVRLRPGATTLTVDQAPLRPGFHTFRVDITPAIDTDSANNSGSTYSQVQGPPKVLVVAAARREAADVMASLKATGIHAVFMTPDAVVSTLDWLQRYAALVIVDTPADLFDPTFLQQLVPYVRDLGHGLVVIGGQESYGLGGYGQTPLETALPVKMDLPKRRDLPSAAVALIIESLEEQTQVNISKRAGEGVVNLLTEEDKILVDDAEGTGSFAVPLQHVRNKAAIDQAIQTMQPGDPMSYAPDLQAAYEALRHTTTRVKHIILLGDGDAEDSGYAALVKRIRAGGVTVSTVATNGLGFNDWATMRDIAKWGGGRYYVGDNPTAIPSIFLREARTVARSGIVTGKFYPQELSANPMVRDLTSVPPLYGYVATTPKPTGEMVLVSKKLDPVLAAWQFGLGRSVAWTSDAAGLWTKDWLRAPGAQRFWSNLVSWVLPNAAAGKLFVQTAAGNGQGTIEVDTPPSLGGNPSVTAHVVDPALHTSTLQLQPAAPGHFRGTFLAAGQGAYIVSVSAHGQGHADAGQAGLDIPYPAEYRTTGTNLPFLASVAAAGGGSVISAPGAVWADNLPGVNAQHPLANWLFLLALLLLPVDIGLRRLIVTRHDLTAIWATVVARRPAPLAAEPAVAPLGTIRARRASATPAATSRAASSAPPRVPSPADALRLNIKGAAPKRRPEEKPRESAGDTVPEDSTAGRLLAAKRKRR